METPAPLFQDPEYQRLRGQVREKITSAQILGALGGSLMLCGFLMTAAIPAILFLAGGITLGFMAFQKKVDADLDRGEMEARRNAVNLGRVFGDRGRDVLPVTMAPGRSDGRAWTEATQPGENASLQQGR